MTFRWNIWNVITVAGYALSAIFSIYALGVHLVPDTESYSRGGSGWSSLLAATVGAIAGKPGVQALGVVGAVALGAVVVYCGSAGRATLLLALMVVAPHYPGLSASPDAIGAAVAVWGYARLQRGQLPLTFTAVCHLEAACVLVVCEIAQRFKRLTPLVPVLAGFGAIAALAVIGYSIGVYPDEFQTRYLLPGFAILCAYARPERFSTGLAAVVTR